MQNNSSFSLKNYLLLPFVLLLQLPPVWILVLMLMAVSSCGYAYYAFNSDFFGLAAPPFDELSISPDFSYIRDIKDNRTWKISFEKQPFSIFHGVVRHVSDWRDEPIPFATHDILVTTGDFSSASKVTTQVMNHAVYFAWGRGPRPDGGLNLLHIIPQTRDIYNLLLSVRSWNLVTISGREIYRIDLFDPQGKFTSYWQDEGCNSILVTSVKIEASGTPIP